MLCSARKSCRLRIDRDGDDMGFHSVDRVTRQVLPGGSWTRQGHSQGSFGLCPCMNSKSDLDAGGEARGRMLDASFLYFFNADKCRGKTAM